MAPTPKHDWPALYKEWDKSGLSRQEWTASKNISYSYVSKKFAEIDRELEEFAKRKAIQILGRNADKAATAIATLTDSDDENIKLKASVQNLALIGISPQASIQATQVNLQVNVPALFANAENQNELRQLLQGGKVIDQDEA